jgi:hypothetical protein
LISVAIPCPVSRKNTFATISDSPEEESETKPEMIDVWAFKIERIIKENMRLRFI